VSTENDSIEEKAHVKACKIADEINAKAVAAGCNHLLAIGYAHGTGSGYFRHYTGHIVITFEALAGGKPRRRTVNDCKHPIDVDKIVSLMVELQGYYDRQSAQWKAENARLQANRAALESIKPYAPSWMDMSANAFGINIDMRGLTAERARAIVDALKEVL
jgi:hypothetical protein